MTAGAKQGGRNCQPGVCARCFIDLRERAHVARNHPASSRIFIHGNGPVSMAIVSQRCPGCRCRCRSAAAAVVVVVAARKWKMNKTRLGGCLMRDDATTTKCGECAKPYVRTHHSRIYTRNIKPGKFTAPERRRNRARWPSVWPLVCVCVCVGILENVVCIC